MEQSKRSLVMAKGYLISSIFLIILLISCNSSVTGNINVPQDYEFDSVLIINPFTDEGEFNETDFYSIEDTSLEFRLKRIGDDLICDSLKGKIVMYYVYDNLYVLFYKHVNTKLGKVLIGNKFYLIKKSGHQIQSTNEFLSSMQYSPAIGDTIYDYSLNYISRIKDSSCYYEIKSYNNDFLELKDSTISFLIRWKRNGTVIQDRLCFQE